MDGKYEFKDSSSFIKAAKNLADKNPLIEYRKIGKSILGKDIFALVLGGRQRESVLFCAVFDGRTKSGGEWLLRFCEEAAVALLTDTPLCDINLKAALIGRNLVFVPLLNPDGADICALGAAACGKKRFSIAKECGGNYKNYKLNFYGTDLNADFGEFAAPESRALAEICFAENLRHAIKITSGQGVIYKSGNGENDLRPKKMSEIMAAVSSFAVDLNCAPFDSLSGWLNSRFEIPAFKIAARENTRYSEIKEMLSLAAIM